MNGFAFPDVFQLSDLGAFIRKKSKEMRDLSRLLRWFLGVCAISCSRSGGDAERIWFGAVGIERVARLLSDTRVVVSCLPKTIPNTHYSPIQHNHGIQYTPWV